MGIPSFYKHLLQTIGGLTSTKRQQAPHMFALDLNCAIYHCVRKIPQAYQADERIQWEDRLIQEVLGYILSMVRLVAPSEVVYIAVDGVAPMAKIKQQRARRFKSAVLAAQEGRVKAEARGEPYVSVDRWDTNAITPGTDFMQRLAVALRGLTLPVPKVIVSPADEPGEGEQKIMTWLRSQPDDTLRDVVVYGLDADLIVLSLLEHARSARTVDLFREETEFGGGVKRDALGEEQYLYLHTNKLADTLHQTWGSYAPKRDFLYSYVGVMNLLGNDFVPHGMVLKINDEGIETVLEILKSHKIGLVDPSTQKYTMETLKIIVSELGTQESYKLLKGIRRKLGSRVGSSASNSVDPEMRAMSQMNDRPVEWAVEKCLVDTRIQEGTDKPTWDLKPVWKTEYRRGALWNSEEKDVCEIYCKTLAWTLDYYMGKPVDMNWYYPWFLPPLLSDLQVFLSSRTCLESPVISKKTRPLTSIQQLAMVLPLTSMSLLPTVLQQLPHRYPHAWPSSWSYFSMGRRFLWECEPLIPLIQPHQIQNWVEECMESDD